MRSRWLGLVLPLMAAWRLGTVHTPPPATVALCPRLPWDGTGCCLDSGTVAGDSAPRLARTDVDLLEHASVVGGRLRLRLTSESAGTAHVDALQVVAVDHPPGTVAAPDPSGGIHVLRIVRGPVPARDFAAARVSQPVEQAAGAVRAGARTHDRSLRSAACTQDAARPAQPPAALILTFHRPAGARRVWLVVDAQSTASPRLAATPGVRKRQAFRLDLRRAAGDPVRVRLTAPRSWARIEAVAVAVAAMPVLGHASPGARAVQLPLLAASARGRDARPELTWPDGRELTMRRGDAVELVFGDIPPLGAAERTFFLRSTVWVPAYQKPQSERSRGMDTPASRTKERLRSTRPSPSVRSMSWKPMS